MKLNMVDKNQIKWIYNNLLDVKDIRCFYNHGNYITYSIMLYRNKKSGLLIHLSTDNETQFEFYKSLLENITDLTSVIADR